MSDNENISMREINNYFIINNERLVHHNSEQMFTITTESELTWPLFHCSYFIKQLPNGLFVQDSMIHALDIFRDFQKA
jgi:hypothetical protein